MPQRDKIPGKPWERLLTIASVQQALRAEKMLCRAGFAVEMIPTPRELSLSCGQCLLLRAAEAEEGLRLLEAARVVWGALYQRTAAPPGGPSRWAYEKLAEKEGETS